MFLDRICETTTTTGTGDITLAGAVTGFMAFSDFLGIGDMAYYLIEAVDGSGVPTGDWEMGRGTYSATNTLTRTTVMFSSAGGAVTFAAGTKRVHVVAPAQALSWRGAWVSKGANQTAQNYTSAAPLAWDSKLHDTSSFWSSGSNTRLTIPSDWGALYVQLAAQVSLQNITASDLVTLQIKQNNIALTVGGITRSAQATTTPTVYVETPPILATGTDYFTSNLGISTDTSIDIIAAESFFTLKVLGEYYN